MHSRLDYVSVPGDELNEIGQTAYLVRGLSDHSPLTVRLGTRGPGSNAGWRLNAWELRNGNVLRGIRADTNIFRENETFRGECMGGLQDSVA